MRNLSYQKPNKLCRVIDKILGENILRCLIISPYGIGDDSLPGGTHYIEKTVRLEPLNDNHKIRIVEYLDSIDRDDLCKKVRKKPVYIIPLSDFFTHKDHSETALDIAFDMHRFSLEFFSKQKVAIAAFNFDGENIIEHAFDKLDLLSTSEEQNNFNNKAWEEHKTYLSFLYQNIHKAPLSPLVIKRLSRAMRAGPTNDGIIDLTIALECLVNASTEIKFQFCLNHALTNEYLPEKRLETFQLLSNLYDIRSKAVHGGQVGVSDKKKMTIISSQWQKCLEICQNSLTYYLLFCSKNKSSDWNTHLRMLSLGENRIGVE